MPNKTSTDFKFQSDSINTLPPMRTICKYPALNSNLILLILVLMQKCTKT